MTSLLPYIFISSSIRKAKNKILLDIINALPLNIKTGELQGYEKLPISDGTKLLLETLKEVKDTKNAFPRLRDFFTILIVLASYSWTYYQELHFSNSRLGSFSKRP